MNWKVAIPGLILASVTLFSGAVYYFYFFDFIEYDSSKFGIISTPSGIILRKQPSLEGERILVLKNGSITQILGETRDEIPTGKYGKDKWYKLKRVASHSVCKRSRKKTSPTCQC